MKSDTIRDVIFTILKEAFKKLAVNEVAGTMGEGVSWVFEKIFGEQDDPEDIGFIKGEWNEQGPVDADRNGKALGIQFKSKSNDSAIAYFCANDKDGKIDSIRIDYHKSSENVNQSVDHFEYIKIDNISDCDPKITSLVKQLAEQNYRVNREQFEKDAPRGLLEWLSTDNQ